jgi:hypothetical protein
MNFEEALKAALDEIAEEQGEQYMREAEELNNEVENG